MSRRAYAIGRTDEAPEFYVTDAQERLTAWLEACPVPLERKDQDRIESIVRAANEEGDYP